jgi:thiol peroxidase
MKRISVIWVLLTSFALATTVAFHGVEVTLNSNGLKVGDDAPVFYTTTIDLEEMAIGGKKDKIQVIAFIPSLDTGICKLETIAFNKKIAQMHNVLLTVVSKDLPYAQQRFCRDNNIKNIMTVSDYKDVNNALRYGATISAPAMLEGLFARVIYIVDTQGKIAYTQVVKEITNEPDYDAIIKALKGIQ